MGLGEIRANPTSQALRGLLAFVILGGLVENPRVSDKGIGLRKAEWKRRQREWTYRINRGKLSFQAFFENSLAFVFNCLRYRGSFQQRRNLDPRSDLSDLVCPLLSIYLVVSTQGFISQVCELSAVWQAPLLGDPSLAT